MARKGSWIFISLILALLFSSASLIASGDNKVKLTKQLVLKGEWRGKADYTSGIFNGRSLKWKLVFAKGDFSSASGHVGNELKEIKAKKFNLKKPFKMTLSYLVKSPQSASSVTTYINAKVILDPTCTHMTGEFTSCAGNGTFEIAKYHCAPSADKMKGVWSGTLTGSKGAMAKKTEEMTLKSSRGKLDRAKVTFGPYEVMKIVPSVWCADSHEAIFFLICKGKGKKREEIVEIAGTFCKDFSTFTGSFKSKKIGFGTVELKKTSHT